MSGLEESCERELKSLTRSVVPKTSHVHMDRKGAPTNGRFPTYSTFQPRVKHVVDSEYLETLLIASILPSDPSSQQSSHLAGSQGEGQEKQRSTNDSGIQSPGSESPPSPPPAAPDPPDFFQESARELRELFVFVEHHLSAVETELGTLAMAPNKRGRSKSRSSDDTDEEEDLVGEATPFARQIQVGSSVLTRLQMTLEGLKESIATSFTHLDKLVGMHDNGTTSKQGREFLDSYSPTKIDLERRIDSHLDKLHSQNWLEDGGLEGEEESKVMIEVQKYRPGCLTLLHVLLFISVWVTLSFMYYYAQEHSTWAVAIRLLRSPFLVVLFLYFYGINIKMWANHSVDYVHIFKFPSRGTPTTKFAWKVAGMFCVIFTIILGSLLFMSVLRADIPVKSAATLMWLLLLLFLFNPIDRFLRKGRFAFVLVIVRILIAPFHTVYFGDFWFADQLNSLVGILLDMQYYVCFMVSDTWSDPPNKSVCTTSSNGIRPIVSALPALWRFMQCLRYYYDEKKIKHLINAVKYFTTFPVIVFATLFSVRVSSGFKITTVDFHNVDWIIVFWGVSSFIHALYTFLWDVYCDWGLFRLNHRTILRPKLLYGWKSFYCVAILIDFILRFAWTLKLTLALVWHIDSDVIYTGLVVGEIFRRFMWNFFRVEYEQTLSL